MKTTQINKIQQKPRPILKLESLKVNFFYKISKIEHFIGKNIR